MSSTSMALQIERWAAWAPGLDTNEAWLHWMRDPQPLRGDEVAVPALPEVPAMARRRIEPLGRAAMQVSFQAQSALTLEQVRRMPLVFASRWGELARSTALLQALAKHEPLSPTEFSHSVHNAIGALYSIQRGVQANVSAVAAGSCSIAAGWLEAMGLIQEGAQRVVLTVFDAPLPADYADRGLDATLSRMRAMAFRLIRCAVGEGIVLDADTVPAETSSSLPHDLRALHWLVGDAPGPLLQMADGPTVWRWSRKHVG